MTVPDAAATTATKTAYYSTQYNARAGIPDHPEIFARWARQSAQARISHLALFDLPFGDAATERLDFFPAAHSGGPLLVFIHGGWWRSLDKSDFSFVAPAFTAAGINVALTNYTLAPAASIEEITLQQIRALAWLYRHGARYGADVDRIVVAGHSAGGHLAAMMMAAQWQAFDADLPVDLVKGGVVFSGLYDLEPVQYADFVNVDLQLTADRIGPLSPAAMPQSHPTPFITAVGGLESDEFKRQNALLGTCWRASQVADVALPNANHLTICDAMAGPGQPLFDATLDLIAGLPHGGRKGVA